MNDRLRAAVAAGAVLVLGVTASAWPAAAPPAARVPCHLAEAWMVDALPGVGPATLASMIVAVRAGRFADLPPAARIRADQLFAAPDGR